MTREQQIATLHLYRERFHRWSLAQADLTRDTPPGMGRAVKHANWMIHEMLRRMEAGEDKPGQVDRWLGFIQGIFWCHGLFSIESLKTHTALKVERHDET